MQATGHTLQADHQTASDEPSASGHQNVQVLIVEDNDATRAALAFILERAGYVVHQAGNGRDAVDTTRDHHYDVILMDVELPVIDGIRALAMLRRQPATAKTKVLIISQHSDPGTIRQCASLGISDFVVKQDLDVSLLLTRIEKVLNVPASQGAPQQTSAKGNVSKTNGPIDLSAWREKVAAIGAVNTDQTIRLTANVELPPIVPDARNQIRKSVGSGRLNNNLAAFCEHDPAVHVRLLGLANNQKSLNAPDIVELDEALKLIGITGLATLLDKVEGGSKPTDPQLQPWIENWWRHSIAVARLAKVLSGAVDTPAEMAHTAGMVHDLGRIVLLASPLADKAIECYRQTTDLTIATVAAEQALFGVSHKQIGVEFAQHLGLPGPLAQICETHHLAEEQRGRMEAHDAELSMLVAAADQLAKASGFGTLPNDELAPLPSHLTRTIDDRQQQLERVLTDVETSCYCLMGDQATETMALPTQLAGCCIAFVSADPGAWNPFQRVLIKAGADSSGFSNPVAAARLADKCDLVVCDAVTPVPRTAPPMLERLGELRRFGNTPRLLLARATKRTDRAIKQCGIDVEVCRTPVRVNGIIDAILRLVK